MTRKKTDKQTTPRKSHQRLVFEELEPRLLLSADLPVDIPAMLAPDRGDDEPIAVHEEITTTAVTGEQHAAHELVFVDTDTPDYQTLIDDLLGNSGEDRLIEVVLLDNSSDGIAQITDTLSQYNELDAVHLISHGSEGAIDLGATRLEFDTLLTNSTAIQGWADAFSEEGDILIYGCNLAASENGQAMVDSLARLTGADVAASDDLTGSAEKGGDWELEYSTGSIETSVAISSQTQNSWSGVLAFTINTTADTPDANPGDTLAEDGSGNTSLRAAIEEANALGGADTITLGAGNYDLSLGTITISSDLTIVGAGADLTVIDAQNLSRVFAITGGTVSISGVTLQNGDAGAGDGGGVHIANNAVVSMSDVLLTGHDGHFGGAIWNDGTLTLDRVTLDANNASYGGGLYNRGNATVTDSTVSNNTANNAGVGEGGGIWTSGAGNTLDLTNVTISGNSTDGDGGGLYNGKDATLTNVTITNNQAAQGAGIHDVGNPATTTLTNTIVAGNGTPGQEDLSGNYTSGGNNLIGIDGPSTGLSDGVNGDQVGTAGSPIDPMLGALADNGGPTQTHTLQTGSTAIDGGTNIGAPTTDQRGATRDASVDIGAHEFAASVPAVALDASSSGSTADQASVTVSHMTSGTNRLMLVGISMSPGAGESVTSVTYNGQNLTLVGTEQEATGTARVEIWALTAPDTGTHDVVVNLSGTTHKGVAVGVMTFNGVNQANPTLAFSGDSDKSTSATTTVASAADDLVFGVAAVFKDASVAPGAGQTEYWDIDETDITAGGTIEAGAASVITSWTHLDKEWAAAAVSIQADTNSVTAAALSPVQDAYIQSGNPTTNTGTAGSMIIDSDTTDPQRGLAQFNLSSIPAGSSIQSATLRLEATDVSGDINIDVYQLLEAWTEGSTTWNESSSGTNWSTAGGEFNATALDSNFIRKDEIGLHSWDITTLVQDWIDGSAQNHGVLIGSPDGNSRTATFDSREGTVAPVLDIVYAPATATILDQFNTAGSFSGNDGTQNWTGDWQELGESNGPSSGNVRVVSSPAALQIGGNGMITGDGALREIDLSQASSATLTFDAWRSASRAATITLAVSDNGGTDWTNRQTWSFSSLTSSPSLKTFDISAFASANTQIRFLGAGEADSAFFYADNIQIEYQTNAAPVLSGANDLAAIDEDPISNGGTLVSALLAGHVSDADTGSLEGIAVIGVDNTSGMWEYSINGGGAWLAFGSPGTTSARLLAADANTYVRFVPSADWHGTVTNGLTFHAWDQTSGVNGGTDDLTGNTGGSAPYSAATGSSSIVVNPVNDAPTFSIGDGAVTADFGSGEDIGNSVAVQADGKILVSGRSYNGSNFDFALTRYNADGTLDTSFSGDGKLTTDFGPGDDHSVSVSVQADGKILAAGYSFNGSNYDFAVVRYNSDGSLDTSFSGDGKLTTAIGATGDIGYSTTLQADGKILVSGYSVSGLNKDFALVRYNTDGTLDTGFSGDGKLTTDFGSNEDIGYSVTLQADGKILVAGQSKNGAFNDFALARYNTDGSLDTSFSGDGMLTTAIGSSAEVGYSVTVQTDGKILVAGFSHNGVDADFALVRYNTDGSLDTSFSGDGKLTTDFGSGLDSGYNVTLQPDGKILVSGFSSNGSNYDFAVARYNFDGSLDASFSGDGMLTTAIGAGDDIGQSIVLQPDGKILVAGQSDNGVDKDITLVRYNADGSLDLTFDPVNTLDGAPAFTEGGAPVVLDADAQVFDVELSGADDFLGATLTLVRNGGANAEDLFSATGNLAALTESGNLVLSGVTIGTVTTNSAGTLVLSFNTNATQARVNETLQSIAYANSSDAPPASVQVDWDFNDGNSGAQGTGGALSATGSTIVSIAAVNDAPTDVALSSSSIDENTDTTGGYSVGTLNATDVDAGDTHAYTIVGGADAALFAIGGAGSDELILDDGILNFETKNSYQVLVRVTDSGTPGLTYDELLTITVNDVTETTTVGAGPALADREVWGGGRQFGVDAFTLQTDVGSDVLTDLTVTFSGTDVNDVAANGVKIWRDDGAIANQWDDADTLVASASFVGSTASFSGLNEAITTTATGYLVTYDIADTATPGNTLQGSVTAATVGDGLINSDSVDATLTVVADMVYETSVYKMVYSQGIVEELYLKNSSSPTTNIMQGMSLGSVYASIPGSLLSSWDPDASLTTIVSNSVEEQVQMVGRLMSTSGDSYGTVTTNITFYEDRVIFDVSVTMDTALANEWMFMTYAVWDDALLDESFEWSGNNSGVYNTADPAPNFNSGNQSSPISYQGLFEMGATDGLVNATMQNISNYGTSQLKNTDNDGGSVDIAFQKQNPVLLTTYQAAVMYSFDTTTTGFDTSITEGRQDDYITPATLNFAIPGGDGALVGDGFADERGAYTLDDNDADDIVKFEFQVGSVTPRYSPVFEITNWNSAAPLAIDVDGVTKNIGTDYTAAVTGTTLYVQYLGNLSSDSVFTLNANSAPTDIALSNSAVDENVDTTGGYSVGTLSATDVDAGDSHTYTIVGGADAALFTIGGAGSDELILDDGMLDFETQSSYQVTVRVTDSGTPGLTYDETVTITVNDLNETPTDIALSNSAVDENVDTTGGYSVGTLTATDPDAGDTQTYSIVGGADAALFTIGGAGSDELILDDGILNFETQSSYQVTVRVTDSGTPGLTYDELLTITVNDLNETPTDIALSNSAVDENTDTTGGYSVGTLTGTDVDAGDSHTYTIVGGADAALFSIGGAGSDELILDDGVLDFETQSSYQVTVRVTDSGTPGLTYDESVTITVNDLNETPTDIVLSNSAVDENTDTTGGYSVGTLTAADVDAGDSHTYTIVGGADAALFTIGGAGSDELILDDGILDFETQGSYQVTVRVTDSGTPGLTYDETVTITVNDLNETPTDIALGNSAVDENTDTTGGYSIGTLTGTDPDAGDTFTYAIVGGADAALFTIGGAGSDELILDDGILNFETQSSYQVTVRVTDSGTPGLTYDETVTITVNDLNETPTDIALSNTAVDENTDTTGGYSVGTLTGTDVDAGDTQTYTIVGGADAALFTIGGAGSDELILDDGMLDFETQSSYQVTVRVTDSGTPGLTYDETVTITVNDLNETPTDIALSNSAVDENTDTTGGYSVGTLTGTDPDAGDTFTYAIVGGADAALFTIGGAGSDELILDDGILNFETQSSYQVTVRVTDSGTPGLTYDETVTITVNDLNETPTDIALSNTAVDENTDTTGGYSVGTLTGTDVDAGDTQTYTIVGGADAALFTIGGAGSDELILDDGMLDFETQSSYQVTVRVTDSGTPGLTYDETVTITVNDLNETPTDIALSNSAVDENTDTTGGYSVGILTGTDVDAGDTQTYTIVGGADAALFTIGGAGSDELILDDGVLDFETQSSYQVTVRVTDSGTPGLTYDETVTITVNDLNEAPTDIALSNSAVDENTDTTGGYSVGTLTATDVDAGDSHTYSIVGGADAALFSIGGAGSDELILDDGILDFETQSSYQVTVRVTDSGTPGLTYDETVTITVNDLNETPTDITLSNTAVDENTDTTGGYSVGMLSATDVDAGDTQTYTIVGGADAALFTIGGAGSDELILDDGVLDFETQSSYQVTVRVTDSGTPGLIYDETVTITVNDLNEAPTDIALSNSAVDENTDTTGGYSIGTLTAADVDAGDTHSYSIVGGADAALFTIGGAGSDELILDDGILDFETQSSYQVTVRVTDSGTPGLTYDELLTITVNDLNEAPTDIALSNSAVDENTDTTGGYSVGTLTATDPDAGDTQTYSIVGGADAALFTIGGAGSDELILDDGILDFETQSSYQVTVRVTDSGTPGLTYDETVTITVNDLNEVPTDISLSNTAVDENVDTTGGYSVGTLSATDVDAGDSQSYTIVGGADAALFTIGGAGSDELILDDGMLDFETQSSYQVTVRVTDSGTPGLIYDETVTITVNDLNETPTDISISNTAVDENVDTTGGYSVGTLTATDVDAGDTQTYTIVGGADAALFTIGGAGSDELILDDGMLDFETQSSYQVTVRVTDSGTPGLTYDELLTITVNDLNEAPTDIALSNSAVDENVDTTGGYSVGTLTATDVDAGDTHSYSIVGGADAALFSIGGAGSDELILDDGILDFETQSSYQVTVRVTDSGTPGLTYDETVTITVNDLNETPTDITLSNTAVDENTDTTGGYSVGTLTGTDVDAGDTHSYSIVGGADAALFTIGGAGSDELILDDGMLDFETQGSYQVTVRVTDSGTPGLTYDETVTITVNDLNEAPTDISTSNTAVDENTDTTGGYSIGTLTATDVDAGDTQTYTIIGGADAALFSIGGAGSDELILDDGVLDFETQSSYQVTVRVTDSGTPGLTYDETVTITVNDLNETPTDISISNTAVDENVDTTGGYSVGTLTAADVDAGDTHSYSIVGGADAALFTIGGAGSDELILDDGMLDFETKNSYQVTVRVTDSGTPGLTYDVPVTITVNDLNETPTDIALSNSAVDENTDTTGGYSVGTLTGTDVDAGDTQTYTIVGGADAALFTIGGAGSDELILDDGVLDFETQSSYQVTVRVTDSGTPGLIYDETVTITVNDLNEAPTDIALSNSAVDENTDTTGGYSIGTLTAADVDAGDTHSYSIVGGADAALFTIGGAGSDELILDDGILDFETQGSYQVTIRVTDSGTPGLTYDELLTITVNDLNEVPTDISISNSVVDENTDTTGGYSIGTLTATDVDAGDTQTYTIIGGADAALFSIGGAGSDELILDDGVLDFETQSSYQVTVRVTDSGTPGLTYDELLTITVNDLNETPTDLALSNSAVDENVDTTGGYSVGTLTATDVDSGDTHSYTIVGGADAALFTIGGAGSDELILDDGVLDFETQSSYQVTVRVTDSGTPGLTYDETVTITVNDLNETPTDLALSNSAVDENVDTTGGYSVGTLTATDVDSGDTHSYTIVGGADAALFTIGGAGSDELILDDGVLDFETQGSYQVTVRVTDSGTPGLTYDVPVTITVNDLNETPTDIALSNSAVDENTDTTGGYSVGTLTGTDVDAGDTQTYTIVGGADAALFTIGGAGSDELILDDGVLDFETQGSYQVTVRVTDSGTPGLTYDETVTITVNDLNETPTDLALSNSAVDENVDTTGGYSVGTLTATDVDSGDTHSYTIVGGADAALFTIGGAGSDELILDDGVLDFETQGSYQVTVRVTDSGTPGLTYDELLTITVNDLNEVPTDISISNSVVDENTDTTGGYSIGTLTATDVDAGDTQTYTIIGGADAALFSIGGAGSDELILDDGVLDFETQSSYQVTVRVTDSGTPGLTYDETVTITVNDLNETPTDIALSNSAVDENVDTTGGYSVGTLTATDVDAGDTQTYTIIGGADAALFSIGGAGSDELILDDGVLDFETQSSYQVTVRVTDSGTPGLTYDELLTITVNDLNETPTDLALSNSAVDENVDTTGGYSVGTLTATDVDSGDTHSYTIVGGADAALFTIGGAGSDELILDDGMLDFETKNSYQVTVRVTDSGTPGLTYDETVTITVNDLNEAPTDISISNTAVDENTDTTGGYSVGTLSATDIDAGDTHSYTIVGGADAALFSVGGVGSDELILDDGMLDFETQSSYQVTVRVTDSGTPGLTYDETVTITVNDLNETPTDIALSNSAVDENTDTTGGYSVGTLTAADVDAGDTHSYSIVGGADAALFTIGGAGSDELILDDGMLDFETQSSYQVTVRVTDSGTPGLTYDELLTITVNDLNETPTDIALGNSAVDENTDTTGGYSIGTLTGTDPDAGDTFTYAIVGGADAALFTIGGAGSDELILDDGMLDFETQGSYQVTVRVTDSGTPGLTYDESVTITVNDLNETPTDIVLSNSAVDENTDTTGGYSVGTLSATDVDAGDTQTYTIVGGADAALFSIGGAGSDELILDDGMLDFETQGSYRVTVRVTDSGTPGLTYDELLTITVNDLNEAPTDIALSNSAVDENVDTTGGYSVGTLSATDVDAGDTQTYTIVGGADAALFTIGGAGSDELILDDGVLDFETQGSYQVTVRVTDSGTPGLTYDELLTITVNDLNEVPTDISISNSVVDENTDTTGGYSIGTLTATDVDAGDTQTYTIIGGADAALFSIGGAGSDELILDDGVLDFETQSSYQVTVRVTDSGTPGLTYDETVTITVNDLNETPTDIALSNSAVDENVDTTGGYSVGTLTATDVDAGDTQTYTIIGGADAALFSIGGAGSDELILDDGVLDFETQSSYQVTVRVTDSGTPGLTYDELLTITVNDLNETPTDIALSNSAVDENTDTTGGYSVGTLTGTDVDAGDSHTYTIVGGADAALFTIGGAGSDELILDDGTLDFETQGSYQVTVRVTDSGTPGLIYDETVTITVNDLNEVPTDISLSNTAVDENVDTTGGYSVGTLSATDIDAGDTHSYTIVGGADAALFTIGGAGSDELILDDGILDFETQSSYQVTVRVTDSGTPGLTYDETVTITVNDLNDSPVANNDSFTVNEGSTTNLNLVTNDTDADDGLDLASITIVSGTVNGSVVVNADGTVDYTHNGSETVADSFTYTINDASGAASNVGTVNLTIDPVNDAPIHSVPAAQSTSGNTPLSFSNTNGNSITVADPDASGAPMEVTLSVSNGSLSLAGTTGLSFSSGDGSSDATMTFTGTAADINTALNGLSFQADAGFEGMAMVQIITDDLGNVGTGGALNALDRVYITVTASAPAGSSQDTLPPLDELIEEIFDIPAPEPETTPVNRVNVNPAAEEATEAATPASGSDTTDPTSDAAVDAMLGSGQGVPTQADVSLPGSVQLFDQNLQPHDDDRPSSVRLIGHVIRQGLVDPFTYAKMLNPLQPDMAIWESIDAMMEQMDGRDGSWYSDDQVLTTTTATGLTVSFTVGYVSWLLRAGYLSASLMSVMPLWREFDPLPVLAATTGKKKGKSADDGKDSRQTNDIESEKLFTSNETV